MKNCTQCHNDFEVTRSGQKYCSVRNLDLLTSASAYLMRSENLLSLEIIGGEI